VLLADLRRALLSARDLTRQLSLELATVNPSFHSCSPWFHCLSTVSEETPRILGVDEWAYRRGKSYGTILVDLERSVPVDLLADQSATTFAAWLRSHPGVQVISRDRAGEYARGARQGAPEALQVADRYHLLRNVAEVGERVLAHHRKCA
jgi:transposase